MLYICQYTYIISGIIPLNKNTNPKAKIRVLLEKTISKK